MKQTLLALIALAGVLTSRICLEAAEDQNFTRDPLAVEMELLVRMKVVSATDYWRTNAVEGRWCDGTRVADLLLKMAQVFEPVRAMPPALAALEQKRIIWNDYWARHAVAGGQCEGRYVANLIRAAAGPLADAELISKFPEPGGLIRTPDPSAFAPVIEPFPVEMFNGILGTQTFQPAYQFTSETRLVETAEAIRALGCTVLKFELSPRYAQRRGNVPAVRASIRSLADLARDEPSHRRVLDMPFAHFVLWAHSFSGGESRWRQGFAAAAREAEYREIYELTAHLLQAYRGTGKTFYLGHWEGDGWLRGSVAPTNDAKVTAVAARGMADWLNTRQRAVDDAKRDTPPEGVQVWHYTEVNHVKLAMQGRPALVNQVLPQTTVDLVSYSSYDTQSDPALLKAALSFIESKLPPKPGLTGRRVFIGEYGFPAIRHPPLEQERLSRQVIRAGFEWGCPLILYWELYNNEVDPDGRQRGFWLIDDRAVKQPVYETHRAFLAWARNHLATMKRQTGHTPSWNDFRREGLEFLGPR